MDALEALPPDALEPLPMDALEALPMDALEPLPMEALEALPPDALEPVGQPGVHELPADALLAVPDDALQAAMMEAAAAVSSSPRSATPPPRAATPYPDPMVDARRTDDPPPMPGLEMTSIEPTRRRRGAPVSKKTSTADEGFVYSVCPGCNSPQPQPVPKFCEQCGTKLRMKSKSADSDAESKKCRECGVVNHADAKFCINCGLLLSNKI